MVNNSYVDQCHDLARQYRADYVAGLIDADDVEDGNADIAERLYRNGYHYSDLPIEFQELLNFGRY